MANEMPGKFVELREKIIAEAQTTDPISELPRLRRIVWHQRRDASEVALLVSTLDEKDPIYQERVNSFLAGLEPQVFALGAPCPCDRRLKIIEMFEEDTEYLVYAADDEVTAPRLFRLSKAEATFSEHSFTEDAFVSALANEWSNVDDGLFTMDRERNAVIEYLRSMPDGYSCDQAADDIENENHYEGDEDEDAIDTTGSTVTQAAPQISTAAGAAAPNIPPPAPTTPASPQATQGIPPAPPSAPSAPNGAAG
jgi:hypothetical protein